MLMIMKYSKYCILGIIIFIKSIAFMHSCAARHRNVVDLQKDLILNPIERRTHGIYG